MTDRKKVVKGLKCLAQKQATTANPCNGCGYIDRPNYAICVKDIASDTLELLKEQEKEIENLKEIIKKADYTLETVKAKLNDLLKRRKVGEVR